MRRSMPIIFLQVITTVSLLSLAGCTPTKYETHFFAMDTIMALTVYGDRAEEAAASARDEIMRLDAVFDPENPSSELYAVNHANGATTDVSEDFYELLNNCGQYTDYFDPSIYPVVRAWGFFGDSGSIPDNQTLRKAMDRRGFGNIVIRPDTRPETLFGLWMPAGMELTFGGAAKGYSAEKAAGMLQRNGVESAILSLGGNVQTVGLKPDGSMWTVGIQDPNQPSGIELGRLKVGETAVVTSGDYERFFEQDGIRYHHILDPKTGYPADSGLRSVTVHTSSGTRADIYSTTLFVMGEGLALDFISKHNKDLRLKSVYTEGSEIGLVLVTDDNRVIITSVLHGSFEEISPDYDYIYYDEYTETVVAHEDD